MKGFPSAGRQSFLRKFMIFLKPAHHDEIVTEILRADPISQALKQPSRWSLTRPMACMKA